MKTIQLMILTTMMFALCSCNSVTPDPQSIGYIVGTSYELGKDKLDEDKRKALEISYTILNEIVGDENAPVDLDAVLKFASQYATEHGYSLAVQRIMLVGIRTTWAKLSETVDMTDYASKLDALRLFRDGIKQAIADSAIFTQTPE